MMRCIALPLSAPLQSVRAVSFVYRTSLRPYPLWNLESHTGTDHLSARLEQCIDLLIRHRLAAVALVDHQRSSIRRDPDQVVGKTECFP